jgi:hypothetical protein
LLGNTFFERIVALPVGQQSLLPIILSTETRSVIHQGGASVVTVVFIMSKTEWAGGEFDPEAVRRAFWR